MQTCLLAAWQWNYEVFFLISSSGIYSILIMFHFILARSLSLSLYRLEFFDSILLRGSVSRLHVFNMRKPFLFLVTLNSIFFFFLRFFHRILAFILKSCRHTIQIHSK